MTQEEKELLLKDLCERLPYGVQYKDAHGYKNTIDIWSHELHTALNTILYDEKPSLYLRPMSSMTAEEINEYLSECDKDDLDTLSAPHYHGTDWLNKKKFDYRGLIPMGLALESPSDMYVIKN